MEQPECSELSAMLHRLAPRPTHTAIHQSHRPRRRAVRIQLSGRAKRSGVIRLRRGRGRHSRRIALHRLKVGVGLRVLGRYPLLVIVAQQILQEVQRLRRDQMLVLLGKVFVPGLARMSAEHAVKVWVELDRVLIQVRVQLVRPQHLRNLDQLVVVVVPMKERLLCKANARWSRAFPIEG